MCKPHKRRGVGRAVKDPTTVLRKLGKSRRVSRRDLGRSRGSNSHQRERVISPSDRW